MAKYLCLDINKELIYFSMLKPGLNILLLFCTQIFNLLLAFSFFRPHTHQLLRRDSSTPRLFLHSPSVPSVFVYDIKRKLCKIFKYSALNRKINIMYRYFKKTRRKAPYLAFSSIGLRFCGNWIFGFVYFDLEQKKYVTGRQQSSNY